MLEEGIRVAIVGLPNAGKSSLFNTLLARERAIVSPTPGTTRDFLEGWVEWDGLPIVLVDTAGLQWPGAELEAAAMRQTREAVAGSSIVLLVIDVSVTTPEEAAALQAELAPTGTVLIRSLHKWDLGALAQWREPAADEQSGDAKETIATSVPVPIAMPWAWL